MNLKIQAIVFFFAIVVPVGFIKPMVNDLVHIDISGLVIGGLTCWAVGMWYQSKKRISRKC